MSLKKPLRTVVGIQFALGVGLMILTVSLFLNQKELSQSQRVQFNSYLLADELRQSSDDLTRLARTYVATGNEKFERQYWTVLDIRNGKSPRPVDYNRIYWDFVSETGQKPRLDGAIVSLHELMVRAGFTKDELEKLTLSQQHSDGLVKTERIAMNAVKGLFADSAGNFTVKKKPDRALAIKLMNDDAYHENKANIMKPIDEFYVMFAKRTAGDVVKNEHRSINLLRSIGMFLIIIISLFGYSFAIIKRHNAERKKAEEALQESKSLIEAVVENVPLMIFLKEAKDLRFVIFNRAGEELLGYDHKVLLGKNDLDLFPPEQAAYFIAKDREVLGGEVSVQCVDIPEEPILTAKKGNRLLHTRKVCIRGADGTTKFLLGISEDITERKQAEEERNSLQEQLVRSEKLAAVGELIAGVVHEINNPLTGIKGLSALLLKETQDEEKKKDLKFIYQSSERIEKIVKNLQCFARRGEPTRKNVNINELIDVVISIRNYEMQARNIKVEKDYQPDLPLVMADPSQLEQVFLNLIMNAEYAIHDNQEKAGTLTIATCVVPDSAGERTVVIEFSDTGAGIPIDVLPKLFNPFFTTKGVGKGTGLGLSVSYGIIKGHGGDISVRNRTEGGAVFTIELPFQ